jgi:hypothetical protein
MKSFAIRAARAINRDDGCCDKVFAYRYHSSQITTAKYARHALAYVLRGSIKRRIDAGSRSGDYKLWTWSPRTVLGKFAVELVETRSHDSRSIDAVNSTA